MFADRNRTKEHANHANFTAAKCYDLKPPQNTRNETTLREFVSRNNLPETMGWILSMKLSFPLKMNYSISHRANSSDCYRFDVEVYFDNHDLDSTMELSLRSGVIFRTCQKNYKIINTLKLMQTVLDFLVIVICLLSFCLCTSSFRKHFKLYKQSQIFFREYRHEELTYSDMLVFVSFWLLLVAISDLTAISGSLVKLAINRIEYPQLYATCSLCFGLAALLSWIGILRYLGYFKG